MSLEQLALFRLDEITPPPDWSNGHEPKPAPEPTPANNDAEQIQWLSDKLLRLHPDGAINLGATLAHLPHSDLASAKFLEETYPGFFTWSVQSKIWRVWNGRIHAEDTRNSVSRLLHIYAEAHRDALQRVRAAFIAERRASGDDDTTATAAYEERWRAHRAYRNKLWDFTRKSLLEAEFTKRRSVPEGEFDRETDIAVVENGVLVLGRDGVRLEPHSPKRLVTRMAGPGVRYVPGARCPVWEKASQTSIPAADTRAFEQNALGLALFGHEIPVKIKGYLGYLGPTDTGKSTRTKLLHRVFGSYAVSVGIETFVAGSTDNNKLYAMHKVKGARLVTAAEPAPGRKIDTEAIKGFTGGDPQDTRAPYGSFVTWEPQALLIIASNQPMRWPVEDTALNNRTLPVAFAALSELDHDLKRKLEGELPGILNWLIEGAERAVSDNWRLVAPESMVATRREMAEDVEPALSFLRGRIEDKLIGVAPEAPDRRCIRTSELHSAYLNWYALTQTGRAHGIKTFSQIVATRFERVDAGGGSRFKGLVWWCPARDTPRYDCPAGCDHKTSGLEVA